MTHPHQLDQDTIIERLEKQFGERIRARGEHAGQAHVVVDREDLLEVLRYLREDPELDFDFLADVTAVDHLHLELDSIPERYAVVYHLASVKPGHRFRVKTPVPDDDPVVPSAVEIWKAAHWGERETHDMFGIEFDGNPDLRRLLMPADYDGFPLRKDYPLRGRGERDDYRQIRRGEEFEAEEDPPEVPDTRSPPPGGR